MSFLHRARNWRTRYARYVLAACYVTVVAIDMPIEYQGYLHENPVFSLLMLLAAPAWILLAIATIPLDFALNCESARTVLLFANFGIGCAANFVFLLGFRLRKDASGNRRLVLTR